MRADLDDLDLVEAARRLDPDAWGTLYRSVHPRLAAFARRRVGHDRAADVVSETMARAVAAVERFDPRGPGFDAWVFGICRHVVADTHRRAARDDRRRVPAEAPADDAAAGIDRDEEAAALRAAYARLSEEDRELLDLRVVAGLTADQTAAVLGKQAGAVRMAQSRALERLRGHFGEVYR
jgi:RNA polymerase sigma-70 factor (ECF subfamily)